MKKYIRLSTVLAITCASLLAAGQLVPSDLMENCKQWKITYPTGSEDKTLCGEPNNEYFYVNDDDDAIVFRAPIRSNNGTTPNSSYIRSELRERNSTGNSDIYWTTDGSHMVYVKQAITHLPINKSHLVATQIHGNKDDGIDDATLSYSQSIIYSLAIHPLSNIIPQLGIRSSYINLRNDSPHFVSFKASL